jgi:hypothetical protein
MTDKMEEQLSHLYRCYVRLNEHDRAAMEKEFFDYFLTARPLRPPRVKWPLNKDMRFRRVYSFLVRKGYIFDPVPLFDVFRKNLDFEDFLWSCENLDPRLYQLLPAVWLRFPLHFKKPKSLPENFEAVLSHLTGNSPTGPDYCGYPYKLLKAWLWFEPLDVRSHRVPGSRLSVRLDPKATQSLNQFCNQRKITRTEAIHLAIRQIGG